MREHTPKDVTVMLTGGHVTPAIATIEEIQSRYPSWRLVFVGRKHAFEGVSVVSEEYTLITSMGIRFLPIIAGRLKREGGIGQMFALFKTPIGYIQAFFYMIRERPSVVVSFGGYVGLPVSLVAWAFGIPVVIHEQTTRPGVANRMIARIAKEICVSFPDTSLYFRSSRIHVTGLPIRRGILKFPQKSPIQLPKDDRPILLIVGGSTGSVSINSIVYKALPKLLRRFIVIHQVGRISETRAHEVARSLPPDVRRFYIPEAYIAGDFYSWAIHNAKIVICRSGANTVMELGVAASVALCVPLPWSANQEQYHNAKYLEQGGGVVLPQHEATAGKLLELVQTMMATWDERKAKAQTLAARIPKDGARRFVDVIGQVVAMKSSRV